jgi:hypothetical protein
LKVSPRWVWPTSVFLVTQLVYLHTLNPALPNDDSAETITAGAILGLQHPPGYALAAILDRGLSLLPLGNFSFRANWGASLLGSFGAALVTWILLQLLNSPWFLKPADSKRGMNFFCAVWGGLSLAFSPTYWINALSAKGGIYLLSLCFQLLILTCLIDDARNKIIRKSLYICFFILGLGLACHWETMVIIVPAVILYLVMAREINLIDGAKATACLALGFSPLLFLPLRAHLHPVLNLGSPDTFSYFFSDLSRSYVSFREISVFKIIGNTHNGTSSWTQVFKILSQITHTQGTLLLDHLKDEIGLGGGLLALVGLIYWVYTRELKVLLYLLISLFSLIGAAFSFLMTPKEINTPFIWGKFFLTLHWIFFILAALGLAWVLKKVGEKNQTGSLWLATFLAGYFFLNVGPQSIFLDQQENLMTYDYGQNLLKSLPKGALFFAEADEDYFSLYYLQQAEHRRPDVIMIPAFTLFEPWGNDQVEKEQPQLGLTASTVSFPDYFSRIIYAESELVVKNKSVRPISYSNFNGAFHRYYLDRQKNVKVRSSGIVWLLDYSAIRPISVLSKNKLRLRGNLGDIYAGPLEGIKKVYALVGLQIPAENE